jgi:hypothetical protein
MPLVIEGVFGELSLDSLKKMSDQDVKIMCSLRTLKVNFIEQRFRVTSLELDVTN